MRKASFRFSTFFIFLVLSVIAMFIGSRFTMATVSTWYKSLDLPKITPPNIVFPIVWTTLYILMAVAATYLWQSRRSLYRSKALMFWCLQLLLNIAWPIIFFGFQRIFTALIAILTLWACLLLCIIYSFKTKPVAGYLLLPYIVWLSYASLLNFLIFQNNFST